MTLQRNHYEVLGVPPTTPTDDIKKRYRELARKFHPDVVKDKAMGQKIFSQINQAYHVLGDPERRTQYDTSLAADANRVKATAQAPAQTRNGTVSAAVAQPLTTQQLANVARLVGEAEQAVMQNKIGNAQQICELVLKTDPRNIKALSILGDVLAQMGKTQAAAAAYRQALQIAPSSLLQAKLSRLEGGAQAAGASVTAQNRPAPSVTRPTPPTSNGTGSVAHKTANTTVPDASAPEKKAEKPSGGIFSKLLGKNKAS